jgi:NADH:ubiquinone oxidoreductase subunit 6 (subunit J)
MRVLHSEKLRKELEERRELLGLLFGSDLEAYFVSYCILYAENIFVCDVEGSYCHHIFSILFLNFLFLFLCLSAPLLVVMLSHVFMAWCLIT